ncbi:hypothetical protein Fleli_2126 [Bernardetia litoralis DSM 6794]|uniref:Outer membrane protein n=1 Tax=Bernardetia litoralis (strain ATCC 23117 / DSM 6794 / NBRC 15988 / NCIMB 1366 / Fx l1 / Sio-4) TaxID=880071 RepID=I4AKM3_BERLS|nr:hypothetical protein [Bernardetia litoralis]AFM04508.1 hypothetical protein Fleli_2126 [Bernardetia litoralis DSM 6794]
MKQFLLSCAFFFLATWAFAQTPEEKSTFLTNQMTPLLSLSTTQVEQVTSINVRRFKFESNAKTRLAANQRYANAKADNFQSPVGQAILTEVNTRLETAEGRYDSLLRKVLDDSQYALYLQSKESLLIAVVNEFGE